MLGDSGSASSRLKKESDRLFIELPHFRYEVLPARMVASSLGEVLRIKQSTWAICIFAAKRVTEFSIERVVRQLWLATPGATAGAVVTCRPKPVR